MDQANNNLTFTLPYHFLKLDNKDTNQESKKINYTIKNHFNTPVLQIKEVQPETDNGEFLLELHASDLKKGKKGSLDSKVLFHTTISNQLNCPDEISPNNVSCVLTSTSGEILSRVIVKDISLSTCCYNVMDNTNTSLLQVSRELVLGEQLELQIKLVFKEDVIARIRVDDDDKKVTLSMAPELDSVTKMRLICLMMMMEIFENRKLDFGK